MTQRGRAADEPTITWGPMMNRRRFLGLTGAGIGTAVLAACGSSGSRSSSASSGGSGSNSAAGTSFIKQTFGGANVGAGLTIPVGAGLLLSTSQAPYGQQSLKGINLAVEEIKAAGGPTFTFNTKDIAVSTTAGANAERGWGEAHIGMALAAGFFDTGSMIPPAEQYDILTFDGGGGTSTVFEGKPYAWGARAITPNDTFDGVMKYMSQKMPKAKRYAVSGYDLGALTTQAVAQLRSTASQLGAPGMTYVGEALTPLPSAGGIDFTSAISKLRGMNPDVIFLWAWGSDPATFMKSFSTAGINAVVIGPDFIPSTTNLAGPAMDGYMFAYDYFNPKTVPNQWGQHFVSAYKAKYNAEPDYYPANYYEETYFLWELVKRVLAKGGNPQSGTDLQNALESDLTLPSVYGGSGATGKISFSSTTHSVSYRPMGLFKVVNDKPVPLAYFNIGGADYRLA